MNTYPVGRYVNDLTADWFYNVKQRHILELSTLTMTSDLIFQTGLEIIKLKHTLLKLNFIDFR